MNNYIETFTRLYKDPIYKSSLFILLSSLSNAGFGFLFWIMAAKLYPKDQLGIAIALISSINLLVTFTRFGLDQSMVKYFAIGDKSKIICTTIIVTTLFAILFGVVFIMGIDIWSPELHNIKSFSIIYLAFLGTSSIISLTGLSFLVWGKSEYFLLQNLLLASRIILLFPLVSLGSFGVLDSLGLASIIALIVSFYLLSKLGLILTRIDRKFLVDSFHLSAGIYACDTIMNIPFMVLPLLILNLLGSESTANYYISYSMASLLFMVPNAFSLSLFIEGSKAEALGKNIIKALCATFIILAPLIVILYFFGNNLLRFVGKDYVNGVPLLNLLIFSSFFYSVISVFQSINKIQKDITNLIRFSCLYSILLLGLIYIFIIKFGFIGVGYAWVLAYGIMTLIIGCSNSFMMRVLRSKQFWKW